MVKACRDLISSLAQYPASGDVFLFFPSFAGHVLESNMLCMYGMVWNGMLRHVLL